MTRQPKIEVLTPEINRVRPVKLNTVGNILAEMQRLYRSARSGNLPVEDLSRFIFALKEIRGTVEAGQTIDHIAGKAGPYVSQINVIGIPSGWFVVGLLGAEAHLPAETAHRLRELLPDAFTPLPPTDIDPTRLPLEDRRVARC